MSGMKGFVCKAILVPIIIVVLIAGMFFAIIEGTIKILENVVKSVKETITQTTDSALAWLGVSTIKNSLPTMVIRKSSIENLKGQLNDQKISTKVNGMTDVILRKMLLTHAATTALSDTACMAEISPEAIIEEFKKKNPTYKDQQLTISDVNNLCNTKNSNEVWKEMQNNPGYTLYYFPDSDNFFYFQDSNIEFSNIEDPSKTPDPNIWFLGIMGSTTIVTETGAELGYKKEEDFKILKDQWDMTRNGKKLDSKDLNYMEKSDDYQTTYDALRNSYTKDSSSVNKIKVYDVKVDETAYYYSFKNKNLDETIEIPQRESKNLKGEERYTFNKDSIYSATVKTIDLNNEIDLSKNSVPIELMMNFLDLTGSDEFLETFIDYAIEQSQASVTAYSLTDEEVTYDKETYDIKNDFTVEIYDMFDVGTASVKVPTAESIVQVITTGAVDNLINILWGKGIDLVKEAQRISNELNAGDHTSLALDIDVGNDNFLAYYDIIYNRKYDEKPLPENRVTSIPDYDKIDYGGSDTTYYVKKLESYLKSAYDPTDGFDLGNISVTEVKRKSIQTTTWGLSLTSVDTWYKKVNYEKPTRKTVYQIGDNGISESKTEYENYDESKMTNYDSKAEETIERKCVYTKLKKQIEENGKSLTGDYEEQFNNDIVDDPMGSDVGVGNESQFGNKTLCGLMEIASKDGGNKNSDMGALQGSDYVYGKYTKTNRKKYKQIAKSKKEVLEESNIEISSSTTDTETKIYQFLSLLRNATGTKDGGSFTTKDENPSIVVRYKDIYEGTVPVGDLLLDNGALMLFELLERYTNTQELVPIFKYMAFLYSGKSYDIETIDQLINFLTFSYTNCSDPLLEWIKSWENGYIKNYIDGTGSYSAASKYITDDKKYYIAYYEESSKTWNFSYGLNLTGGGYEAYFAKYSLEKPESYCHAGAKIKVSVLDEIYKERVRADRQSIVSQVQKAGFNLPDNQIDALLAIKYQYGNIQGFNSTYTKYKNDMDTFKKEFWVRTYTGGKAYPFVNGQPQARAKANWELFSKGIYRDNNGKQINSIATGDIATVAKNVHDYISTNNYSYGHSVAIRGGSKKVTAKDMRNQSVKEVNCISYCTWVYCEAGYIDEVYFGCSGFDQAASRGKYKNKFIKITNYNQLQPGDIMMINENGNNSTTDIDHAEIYMGPNKAYNAGSTRAIRGTSTTQWSALLVNYHFVHGYRIKK